MLRVEIARRPIVHRNKADTGNMRESMSFPNRAGVGVPVESKAMRNNWVPRAFLRLGPLVARQPDPSSRVREPGLCVGLLGIGLLDGVAR